MNRPTRADLRGLRLAGSIQPAGDASDAGMVFYVLTGVSPGPTASSNPDMAAVKAFFGQ